LFQHEHTIPDLTKPTNRQDLNYPDLDVFMLGWNKRSNRSSGPGEKKPNRSVSHTKEQSLWSIQSVYRFPPLPLCSHEKMERFCFSHMGDTHHVLCDWASSGVLCDWASSGVLCDWASSGVLCDWANSGMLCDWASSGVLWDWGSSGVSVQFILARCISPLADLWVPVWHGGVVGVVRGILGISDP
jgi:hypothetical protein